MITERSTILHFRRGPNQEKHFEQPPYSRRIEKSSAASTLIRAVPSSKTDLCWLPFRPCRGEVHMSGQVVLYFEDQADALRFALAAGSVMAGDGNKLTSELAEETARATRIRLDAVTGGKLRKPSPGRAA
jgi:hypothetical protein